MAQKRGSSPYDGNAARQIAAPVPRREQREKDNIIELTEKQLRKARRASLNPFKIVATVLSITVIFSLVAYSIYGQVQLTELTEQINTTTTALSQLRSVEVQLEMQAASSMDISEMEALATGELGMEKINNNQVIYVNLAEQDQGTVYIEDSQNFFEKLLKNLGF